MSFKWWLGNSGGVNSQPRFVGSQGSCCFPLERPLKRNVDSLTVCCLQASGYSLKPSPICDFSRNFRQSNDLQQFKRN